MRVNLPSELQSFAATLSRDDVRNLNIDKFYYIQSCLLPSNGSSMIVTLFPTLLKIFQESIELSYLLLGFFLAGRFLALSYAFQQSMPNAAAVRCPAVVHVRKAHHPLHSPSR